MAHVVVDILAQPTIGTDFVVKLALILVFLAAFPIIWRTFSACVADVWSDLMRAARAVQSVVDELRPPAAVSRVLPEGEIANVTKPYSAAGTGSPRRLLVVGVITVLSAVSSNLLASLIYDLNLEILHSRSALSIALFFVISLVATLVLILFNR